MILKFRRNLPLVLLLVGILSLLALTMGDQQIVSYTVNTQALQAVQVSEIRVAMAGLFGAVP
jgi:hypothetical protein